MKCYIIPWGVNCEPAISELTIWLWHVSCSGYGVAYYNVAELLKYEDELADKGDKYKYYSERGNHNLAEEMRREAQSLNVRKTSWDKTFILTDEEVETLKAKQPFEYLKQGIDQAKIEIITIDEVHKKLLEIAKKYAPMAVKGRYKGDFAYWKLEK